MKYLQRQQFYIKYVVLVLAIFFIIVGIIREEHMEVIKKAIRICLECIGVG